MALTEPTAAILAMKRAGVHDEAKQGVMLPDVIALEPLACKKFAQMIAADDNKRHLLRKDYTLTLSSGTVDMTTQTGSGTSNSLLLDSILQAKVLHSGDVVQPLPDLSALTTDRSRIYKYYTRDGLTLRTVDTSGSLTGLTGTLTVNAPFVPNTVAEIPFALEEDFIRVLVSEMVRADG